MTTALIQPSPSPRLNPATVGFWATRAFLTAWAGFWLWFIIASANGDQPGGLKWRLLFGGIAAALVAVSWAWQRIGGVLMVAAAMTAAYYFHNPGAYILLALPAAAIGLMLILIRRPSPAAD
jgi:hypothetical protein